MPSMVFILLSQVELKGVPGTDHDFQNKNDVGIIF